MNVRGVDFVCYYVSDFPKALAFYRDSLGLTVTSEFAGAFAEFDLGNVTLAIGSSEMMGVKIDIPQGNAVVALAVEDIHKTIKDLKEKGIESSEVQDFPDSCSMATIMDPSGNSIMLHQRKDGTAG